jgi:membrane protease YdiL (CAAX protease family)
VAFGVVLGLALLAAAALSPAIQTLLAPVHVFQLHRIFNRLTMIGVLAATAWLVVRNGLASREILGFGLPAREFARQALTGLAAGLALMLLVLVPLLVVHVRVWNHQLLDNFPDLMARVGKALMTGCAVALVEETFFRGAAQGSMTRAGSIRTAIFLVPLVYAALHFFGEAVRIPYEAVTPGSGFTVLAGFFRKFAYPTQIADAYVALYFLGVLLALVRYYTGSIAGCIGLHAGIVFVDMVARKITLLGPDSPWMFAVGSFDYVLGTWSAIVAALSCWIWWSIASTGKALSTAP